MALELGNKGGLGLLEMEGESIRRRDLILFLLTPQIPSPIDSLHINMKVGEKRF